MLSHRMPDTDPTPPDTEMPGLIGTRIAATELDLSGLTVITEAATGAYAATAAIAAAAGARKVYALARDTARHGSAPDAERATLGLAAQLGVAGRIEVVSAITPAMLGACDILTNSGHLRPISEAMIRHLPKSCVIGLMFEDWEFRSTDLDLAACNAAGIKVAAVNERHPAVGVFDFLGPLCVRLLENSGMRLLGAPVALLCDNPFAVFVAAGLTRAGAHVTLFADPLAVTAGDWRAVVVSLTPADGDRIDDEGMRHLARSAPNALIAQFWGDIDREAARHCGFSLWPPAAPGRGHMAILLNALGPEPIVRLQTGGLKAAELAFRGNKSSSQGILHLL